MKAKHQAKQQAANKTGVIQEQKPIWRSNQITNGIRKQAQENMMGRQDQKTDEPVKRQEETQA